MHYLVQIILLICFSCIDASQDDEPSLLIQIRPMPQSAPQQIQSQPTSEGNKLSKPVMESGFTPIVTGPSLDPLVAFLNGINCLQGVSALNSPTSFYFYIMILVSS